MSNVTITQLPVVTSIASSDVLPVVATGVTSQISTTNLGNSLTVATASYAINSLTATAAYTSINANYALTASSVYPLSGAVIISGALSLTSTGQTAFSAVGNQNGYIEFSMRNTSTGASASGDIAVYADNGTVLNNYIDMGINNSGLSPTYYYGGTDFGNALDAYLYNVGGNLRIGNATSQAPYSQSFYLFSNPAAAPDITITGSKVAIGSNFITPQYNLDVSGSGNFLGNLTVTGSIIGNVVNAYGSPNYIITANGFLNNPGSNTIALGQYAAYQAYSANNSNFLGSQAGISATNAIYSNFLGASAGAYATTAQYSNFLGLNAGYSAISANNSNFLGNSAGYGASTASYSNLFGFNVGSNSLIGIGSNNIIIGTNITVSSSFANGINIGGLIFGSGSYSNTVGNAFSGSVNGKIGINQPNPQYNLDISGSGNFSNGQTVSGSVFISGSKSIIGSNNITGSLNVSGSTTLSGSLLTTGSLTAVGRVVITGSLWMSATGSFAFPLSASAPTPTGSAYWSGSWLWIYDGTRYRSASFN